MSKNITIEQKTIMSKMLRINDKDRNTFLLSYYRQQLVNSKIALRDMYTLKSNVDSIIMQNTYLSNEQLIKELSLLLIDIVEIISYL